jgi:mycothiol synthase
VQAEQTRASDVVIEQLDLTSVTDEELTELHAFFGVLHEEAQPEDPQSPVEQLRIQLQNIPAFVTIHAFRAALQGTTIGWAVANWLDMEENRHLCSANVSVHPSHRRRGVGTDLLRRLTAVTEAAGRTLIAGNTHGRVPAGASFAEAIGAQAAIEGHINRLVLEDVDRDMVRRWIEDGPVRAPGYSLVFVDGPYPDGLIDAIVDLGHVMNTAPRDNLDMEDQHFTPEQFREFDKGFFASGSERWYVAARHDETGQLVGFTELMWNPSRPKTMSQGGTGVRPDHRGHALGKWLKATNIERVLRERPEVEDIRTGNADSNDPMLGINKQLGFKPYITDTGWQVNVERVKEYLDGRA